MAGLFGVMGTAGRGLLTNSLGIKTASHNIANVETPGYSRQRQELAATRPEQHPSGHLGTGVEQLSVERITDAFVREQLVRQASLLGSSDAQAQALSAIEELFNEQAGEGLSAALNDLYDAFSDLASATAPGAAVERESLRSSAQALVDTLHTMDRQLRSEMRGADQAIRSLLPEINRSLEQIAALNEEVVRLEIEAPANDARDQRDLLVRELGELVDVQSLEAPNGAISISLGNGLPLLEGGFVRQLVAVEDPTNAFSLSLAQVRYQDAAGSDFDVTGLIGGGRLGGLLRSRDTLLAGAIRSLDTVAYNLAVSTNAVHAAGTGLNGASGDFFAALPGVEDAARDLALAPGILADPDAIAAGLSAAPSDNRNALALAGLRTAPQTLFLPGDPPGPASGPSRTLLEHVATIASDAGQQARSAESSRVQQERILERLEDRRDAVSGVSLDEEMTQLIELQAAFQANSRVISLVDELLDELIGIL